MAHPSQSAESSWVAAPISGAAVMRASSEELAPLRKKPGAVRGKPIAPNFLKHGDDQTVAAVVSVLRLIDAQGWHDRDFSQWGVVAAPNFFGRPACAQGIQDFLRDGPWGMSPHLIPHLSLHAISGTVSMALGIHGANFGISAGPNAAAEAFLVAGALLVGGNLPGLLVTLTGHAEELIPGQTSPTCLAAVLALEPAAQGTVGTIEIGGRDDADVPEITLPGIIAALEAGTADGWRLAAGGTVRLGPTSGVLNASPTSGVAPATPRGVAA